MNMQIDYETERELGIDYETLAVKVADKVLEMEKCPYDAQVNLVLTDNEEIERVNTEFRDIARPTDVVSLGRSFCEASPVMITLEPNPIRVRNIFICAGVVFCASSRMINALSSVRPRIYASGATSIRPRSIFFAKLSAPMIWYSAS